MSFINQVEEIVKHSACQDYRINAQHKVRYEAYFVKHDLDILRKAELETCQVVVYVDSEEGAKRGSAEVMLNAAYSLAEMKAKIEEACILASYVKEEYYPLPQGLVSHEEVKESNLKEQLASIAKALMDYPTKENEALNSFEIFVSETEHVLRNSQGLDVSYTSRSNFMEVIVNVIQDGHEIEISHEDQFAHKTMEELQADLKRILQYGQDKMIAKPLNVDIHRVAICNRDVEKLLGYFEYQISAYPMYAKLSNAKIGEVLYSKECQGDKLNLRVCAKAENASSNPPCNSEGIRVKDAVLIEEGKVCHIMGNAQYGHYLKHETVPSLHRIVKGGKFSEQELKQTPYLECVEFSDFSVDVMSGDFAGEIRLAYYFDGETTMPFTKGSISGNIKELGTAMYFTKETCVYDGDIFPKSVFVEGVRVAKGE